MGDAEQDQVLSSRQRRPIGHSVRNRRPARPVTQHTDQSPDRDAPDPRCGLARLSPARRIAPHCNECVLHGLGNNIGIRATVAKPGSEPWLVANVQRPQRSAVTGSYRGNQFRVTPPRRVALHTHTVAHRGRIGSRTRAVECFEPPRVSTQHSTRAWSGREPRGVYLRASPARGRPGWPVLRRSGPR